MRQRTILFTILTVFVCVFAMAACATAKTIYVDADAAGANDGSSWANAYNDLQHALNAADTLAKPVEIRVAHGTYRPDWDEGYRTEAFELRNGVAIKGGYPGLGEPDPNARDIELYETILSGDISGNDIEVADPCDLLTEPARCENSYHVVTAYEVGETAILDGCTITGANANGLSEYDAGGGMDCSFSRPTIIDCTFTGNSAEIGGGMFIISGAPVLIDCRFRRNAASYYGGGIGAFDNVGVATMAGCEFEKNWAPEGGGIGAAESKATLTNCIFIENSAYSGGGLSNYYSNASLFGCTFVGNSASETGGAISNHASGLILTNCSFRGNSAEEGGAIYNYIDANHRMVNCTFTGNSAIVGNAMACDSLGELEPSNVQLTDCILWDGGNEIWNNDSSEIMVRYSDVQGGWPGEDNIHLDPCFAHPGYWDTNGTPEDANDDFWADGDYHLKSQAGRWDASEGRWMTDDVTSPCIDAGDPMTPIGPEPFPNGGIINMGVYGGTTEASKSYFGKPPCETIVAGDINGDCEVNFEDFRLMALHWLEEH